jgi:hypothetical protein
VVNGQRSRGAFGCRWDLFCRALFLAGAAYLAIHGAGSDGDCARACDSRAGFGACAQERGTATSGPYAYTRNPLYLGSLLMGLGFAVAARSWWVGIVLVVMFFAIYLPVIRDEEAFLRIRIW